jgi:hypothetical protein
MPASSEPKLSSVEQAAAFKAAGFTLRSGHWRHSSCDDPGTASYSPGEIEKVQDLNGDGAPEAIIVEGSTFCYGATGAGYSLVTRQKTGGWRLLSSGPGMIIVLPTKSPGGWADIAIGGPGFCFPVHRRNEQGYGLHRYEYEGKKCRPKR